MLATGVNYCISHVYIFFSNEQITVTYLLQAAYLFICNVFHLSVSENHVFVSQSYCKTVLVLQSYKNLQ